MLLQRFYLSCLSHASYLIADQARGIAAVVDPQRDVDDYVEEAKRLGVEIRYVILTHFHADFVAGHIELRNQCGAKIYMSHRAQAEFEFTGVRDGDVLEFGDTRLEFMETPGHTPEGLSILVYDLAQSGTDPHAVLTGDTLFIGDVGRPDLLASIGVTADELADMLYDSLHNKLMLLPDQTLVYPAHGAGSMCGKNLSDQASSTIGEQRRYNYALQPMTREAFKAMVTSNLPEAPSYFVHDAILNRQERSTLDESLTESLNAMDLNEVLAKRDAGEQVIDVREAIDFAAGHLKGSLNIGLAGKYATWCGTMLDKEQPIVVIAEPGSETEAVMRLGRIGFDKVSGFLKGGIDALEGHPEHVQSVNRATAYAVYEHQAEGDAFWILDVRNPAEFAAGHLPDATNIPLGQLAERIDELPSDRRVLVHCQGGYRSSLAISLLQRSGKHQVTDLVGGFQAWSASQLPIVGSDAPACGRT